MTTWSMSAKSKEPSLIEDGGVIQRIQIWLGGLGYGTQMILAFGLSGSNQPQTPSILLPWDYFAGFQLGGLGYGCFCFGMGRWMPSLDMNSVLSVNSYQVLQALRKQQGRAMTNPDPIPRPADMKYAPISPAASVIFAGQKKPSEVEEVILLLQPAAKMAPSSPCKQKTVKEYVENLPNLPTSHFSKNFERKYCEMAETKPISRARKGFVVYKEAAPLVTPPAMIALVVSLMLILYVYPQTSIPMIIEVTIELAIASKITRGPMVR